MFLAFESLRISLGLAMEYGDSHEQDDHGNDHKRKRRDAHTDITEVKSFAKSECQNIANISI